MAEEKTRKEDVELKKPDQGSEVVVDEKKAAKAETKKSETKTEEKTSLD